MRGVFIENIKIAFSSIKTQKLRTFLTVFIIGIGITALVCILSVVSALEYNLNSSFASMGSNTFNINRYEFNTRRNGGDENQKINPIISYPEAKAFKENFKFPSTNTSLSFYATSAAEVKFENEKTDPEISVVGIDEFFIPNSGLEVTQGRNFNKFDIDNNTYSCIVGSDFASKGLLKDINPIGKLLSVRGAKFKVIGVLKEKGSTFGNSQDLRMMIPIQVARSMFSAPNINYTISSMVQNKEFLESAIDQALITMRQIRKLNPVEDNNFGISRSDDLINRIGETTGVLNISAWVIGIITILGSSIALMNIMVVSVTERTREIGVRKSLGAKKSTIAWQFFVETLIIGQLGGILGIILGISFGYLLCSLFGWTFVIPWMAIFAAFATSFVVAVVSGSYPAIKASNLDPIEALRYE
ncbi:ABC transporter permease [Flavobacterium capsici]|uniref:ABC transporter permease n=1 Tax=Flavobacterium capsici TaxID=3075618 RepID=A0AA96EUY0_9FLAO|nr:MULTISPECIES: ABC transporter permease [unclassified Flavobacterium]WNM19023.1 ABC transporter permease [Flavobacterium sp. PMR2A8]WNM23073.1 ABC transporter permease [Flavobacterium sp. PMTSA4]